MILRTRLLLTFVIAAASFATIILLRSELPDGGKGFAAPYGGTISGTAYDDLNGNGIKNNGETGLIGVAVTATDNLGNTQSGTTDSSGNYTLASLPGTKVRIEFGLPPSQPADPTSQYSPTVAGDTSVQFLNLTSNLIGVNAGFLNRTKWCLNNTNIAVPCWAYGKHNDPSLTTEPVLVSVPYNTTVNQNNKTYLANSPQIGSTWGMAYQQSTELLFASAVIRRHTDTGPMGVAGLYAIKPGSSGGGTVVWGLDLNTLSNTFGAALTRDLTTKTTPNHDTQAFDKVGKSGIGDIDLSEDGNTLWVVNLEARALVRLNVTNGAQPTSLTSFDLASASGVPTCTNGVLRPWGLKLANSKGYLGVVCTGETATGTPTQTRTSLSAHVLSFNPTVTGGAMAFTQELNINDLSFQRGYVWNRFTFDGARHWNSWQSTLDSSRMCSGYNPGQTPRDHCLFPTPILSDIEFDDSGNMILGFIDRTSIQMTGYNYSPNTSDTVFYQNFSGGDLLRACLSNGAFQLENNGSCGGVPGSGVGNGQGPGGGEFYAMDIWVSLTTGQTVHFETMQGGLAVLKGLNPSEIVSIIMDPITYYSGGLGWYRNTDGGRIKVYEIFDQSSFFPPVVGGSFKATGLGDIELYCANAPLELGNRIWRDLDSDGIQDADETGMDGVTVSLYQNNTLVGQTTTANGGKYLFNSANVNLNGASGIRPSTTYEISVATNSTPLQSLFLSPRDSDPSTNGDLHDSDAQASGSNAVIRVTTGAAGQSDHNLDFGFGVLRMVASDPASCLGSGSLSEIVVEMGNPTLLAAPDGPGAELTIDLPTNVSRIVSATAKTTSSGSGTVSLIAKSQILWNGALNAGDKLILTYVVLVGDIQPGALFCPRSTAAWDFDLDGTKDGTSVIDLCVTASCPTFGPGSAVPVDTTASDQMGGSVLIYNLYSSGVNVSAQDTRFTITNTNSITPIYVHLFFIDGQTCSVADRMMGLTPNQTTSFLASDLDPLTTGYLLAVAVDQNGCPTRFNHLIGGAYVKFESGHQAALNALAVTAAGPIQCDPSVPFTTLVFDGLTYGQLPRTVAITNLSSVADGNRTMLVVNRLGGNLTSGSTSASRFAGLLFNDIERPSSFSLSSSGCQMVGIISSSYLRTVPRYDEVIPTGRTGWIKFSCENDQGLSGVSINYNVSNQFNQGHNLHSLTLTGQVTYVVPIYPVN